MTFRAAPLVLIALLPLVMGFSRKVKFTITFHAQADDMDSTKTMFPLQIEGKQLFFKIVPEASQENIVAFHPFDSDTGDKGVALQLDFRGRGSIESLTRMKQGQVLLAMVNAKPVDYVLIDQVIDNGVLTVWRGVPNEVIAEMDKKYRRINPSGPPSMTRSMEMMPVTDKEKKRLMKQQKDQEKAAEKLAKSGKSAKPEVQNLSLPSAPVSSSIPVEGGSPGNPVQGGSPGNPVIPPKATPVVEPPLPKP